MSLENFLINDAAFIAVLKDPQVKADLMRRGKAIADAAGGGKWNVKYSETPSRAHVTVTTGDMHARHAEASKRRLTSALDAGRG